MWNELADGNLKNHLFRQGTTYALEFGTDAITKTTTRLCNFGYLMERLKSLPASEVLLLCEEYKELERRDRQGEIGDWARFMQGNAHLLGCGNAAWSANRILLQIGVEHADNSPITVQAEAWLEKDENCNWLWMRSARRSERYMINPCLRTLVGHTDCVIGVHLLEGDRALSWGDHLRIWDLKSGACTAVFEGHADTVSGVHLLEGDRALSWCGMGGEDHTLRIWDLKSGVCTAVLEGHSGSVRGVRLLEGGRALSCSFDHTLRIWDLSNGACTAVLEGHTDTVWGVHLLEGDRALSWADDKTLRIWDLSSGLCLNIFEDKEDTYHYLNNIVYPSELETAHDQNPIWKEFSPNQSNSITAEYIESSDSVYWYGNQPAIEHFTDSGSWLVVNAAKEVKVLHPWQGNRRLYCNAKVDEVPCAI